MTEKFPHALNVLDTFSGAGGFSLGFEKAGCKIVGAIELDQWACDTFKYNHPSAKVVKSDISNLSDQEIVTNFGAMHVDIVVGGPPCQGFSIANRKGGDPKDPRNSLFKDFVRIGRVLSPNVMVMENVPNLLTAKTHDGKPVIEIIAQTLTEIGYHVRWKVLQATDFGVPQIRSRLFVIASKIPLEKPFPTPTHKTSKAGSTLDMYEADLLSCPTLWDAISDLPELQAGQGSEESSYISPPNTAYQLAMRAKNAILFNHKAMNHTPRMVERFSHMEWGHSASDAPTHLMPRKRNSVELTTSAYDQNNRRMFPLKPCHTIAASFYANFVHPFQHRNFTAREGARIQSFPDSFRFLGKPTVISHKLLAREGREAEKFLCQYSQIGNAVPPLLAQAVAENLINQISLGSHVRTRQQLGAERNSPEQVSG